MLGKYEVYRCYFLFHCPQNAVKGKKEDELKERVAKAQKPDIIHGFHFPWRVGRGIT